MARHRDYQVQNALQRLSQSGLPNQRAETALQDGIGLQDGVGEDLAGSNARAEFYAATIRSPRGESFQDQREGIFGPDFGAASNVAGNLDDTRGARIKDLRLSAEFETIGGEDARLWLRKAEIVRSVVQPIALFDVSNLGHVLEAFALDANTSQVDRSTADYVLSQSAFSNDIASAEWGSAASHAIRCMCARCTSAGEESGGPLSNNPLAKDVWDLEQIVFNLLGPNRKWGSNTITFGFFETTLLPSYGTEGTNGFVAFNAGQRNFARQALRTWADAAGLTFVETAVGVVGDIMFGNTNTGSASQAYAYYPLTGSSNAANGDVWMNSTIAANFDPQLGNYPYLAMVHEIGHALGISHPGPYNAAPGVSITYDNNALYRQDTNMYTIMSYFSATVTGANWTRPDTGQYVQAQTPMIHDIAAIQRIYGANLSTRTGATTYGFNASTDITGAALVGGQNPNRIYDFTINPFPVIAIWDAGGNDTIDLSGFTRANVLDLGWGAFSNINGMVNNLSIAYGATIETGIGGAGGDSIYGNQFTNRLEGRNGGDTLDGRGGNDILIGGEGADTIIGGTGLDSAVLRGVRSQFTITPVASSTSRIFTSSLTPTDSDTIAGDVERIIYTGDVNTVLPRDFNNDFRSDTLSRALSGTTPIWSFDNAASSGGIAQSTFRNATTNANFRMVGSGDFNRDGLADLLWIDGSTNSYLITSQTASASGFLSILGAVALASTASSDWRVVGTGDFDGNGSADLAWRNVDGSIAVWLMDGVSAVSSGITLANLGADWNLITTADWDGDDKTDLIFRNSNGSIVAWNMNGTAIGSSALVGVVGQEWTLEASLDIDGDRRADLVFLNRATGVMSTWLNKTTGIESSAGLILSPSLSIRTTGDFNGDGYGDLVLQAGTTTRTVLYGSLPGAGASPWTIGSWTGGLFAASEVIDLRRAGVADVQPRARLRDWSHTDGLRTLNFGRAGVGQGDIVIARRHDGQIDGFLTTSTGVVATTAGIGAATRTWDWTLVGQGDFDGNGTSIDLLYRRTDGQLGVDLYNASTGAWTATNPIVTFGNRRIDAVGDYNGDGITDVIWRQQSDGTVWATLMGASPSTAQITGGLTSLNDEIQGMADLDGDGRADLIWRNGSSLEIRALLTATSSNVLIATNPGNQWDIAGFGNFVGDSKSDILWRNTLTNELAIWEMNGATQVSAAILGSTPGIEFQIQGIADMNGDGRADIVWRHTSGYYAIWNMNGYSIVGTQTVSNLSNAWLTTGKTEFFSGSV
jgi:Peptidase M10 serralysin C terminal/FG-GAP-like repeat